MTERYCRDCGAQLRPGANYCGACGRQLPAEPRDSSTPSGQAHDFSTAKRYGPKRQENTTETRTPQTDADSTHEPPQSGSAPSTEPQSGSAPSRKNHPDAEPAPKQRVSRQGDSGRTYRQQESSGADSQRRRSKRRRQSAPPNQQSPYQFAGQPQDTTLATVVHLLGLVSSVFGPLIVYAISDDPFVKESAANALNWQIMFLLYSFVSGLLVLILVGVFFLIALGVANLAFCIVAAVRASEGDVWEYPLTPSLV